MRSQVVLSTTDENHFNLCTPPGSQALHIRADAEGGFTMPCAQHLKTNVCGLRSDTRRDEHNPPLSNTIVAADLDSSRLMFFPSKFI